MQISSQQVSRAPPPNYHRKHSRRSVPLFCRPTKNTGNSIPSSLSRFDFSDDFFLFYYLLLGYFYFFYHYLPTPHVVVFYYNIITAFFFLIFIGHITFSFLFYSYRKEKCVLACVFHDHGQIIRLDILHSSLLTVALCAVHSFRRRCRQLNRK